MAEPCILIVSDQQADLAFLASTVLEPRGYQVLTATSGQEGLERALAQAPDLLLIAGARAKEDGLELLAGLSQAGAPIPALLTALSTEDDTAIQAPDWGLQGYLAYPYAVQDLPDAVAQALAGSGPPSRRAQDAQTRRHLEARVRGLNSLCHIGRALMGLEHVEEVARVALDAAIHIVDGARGDLFLISRTDQRIRKRAVREASDAQARMIRLEESDALVREVIQSGQASAEGGDELDLPGPGARWVVPLRQGDTVLGALSVTLPSGRPSSNNDRYHLSLVAGFAAEAVHNARVITDLRVRVADLQMVSDLAAEATRLPSATLGDLRQWVAELEDVTERARAWVDALAAE